MHIARGECPAFDTARIRAMPPAAPTVLDLISGWRWFLGAWGVGTYRQNDSVDVRYDAPDGTPRVAEGLEIQLDSDRS